MGISCFELSSHQKLAGPKSLFLNFLFLTINVYTNDAINVLFMCFDKCGGSLPFETFDPC